MKILYQDLISYLSDKPTKELLSKKLFQLGHEHEINGDIFDMELTPNRGDCLSLLGLARDLNIFFGNSQDMGIDYYNDNIDALEFDFENFSPSDCPKISFIEIEIEEPINNYKPYLENYFKFFGNKKTNFFTDISNFISYELGQPTHCFDRKTIDGKLIFENKECNTTFQTLLGSEFRLKDKNCVFTLNNEIISLAGVMGGASTACTSKTKKVLVECAYFNPESIIGKSVKYNLVSDASHKFERGVDIGCQEMVLRRFIKVVSEHATIKAVKIKSFSSDCLKPTAIPIDLNKIKKVLGIELEEHKYLNYLQKLGFEIIDNQIKVPSYRNDIKTQNDLAEEIARVIGYDNIKSEPVNLNKLNDKKEFNRVDMIETFLYQNGFSEVINFPFSAKKEKNSIKIDNPLDKNRENFRTSIKDSLVENLLYNERRQKESIKLFEIADIYTKQTNVKQEKHLGIIISGRLGANFKEFSRKLDYKYLNHLLNTRLENDYFQINEISRINIDTKKKDKIFYVEVPINDIPSNFFSSLSARKKEINFIAYKPISDFPSSTRDFSFSITNLNLVDRVIECLEIASDEIIKDAFIFDFYKNENTNSIKLGYRFIFQSQNKTLSDEEINKKVQDIINPIIEMDGVSIPGM
jgi:phenylalanyl-tRNA synthetase beta chain